MTQSPTIVTYCIAIHTTIDQLSFSLNETPKCSDHKDQAINNLATYLVQGKQLIS